MKIVLEERRDASTGRFLPDTGRPIEERFWSHVDRSAGHDACWPWTLKPNENGYGFLARGGRGTPHVLAHRLAYDLAHPDDPLGDRKCLHSCDNPPCCNERHLRAGTQAENMRDMALRSNAKTRKLTIEQVREIRALLGTATLRAIGMRYGVTADAISRIKHGHNWRHLQ